MNKKGFAISVILYSMVFLLVSIFYMLLGIAKTRYSTSTSFRNNIMEEFNESHALYDKIIKLCDNTSITYVEKYNTANGAAMDTPDGSGSEDVCYYTTTSLNRNSDAEKNSNVIFGNFCWQIVRTTADGGVKLIYNGPKTADDKCPSDADSGYSSNPRPSSIGVIGNSGGTISENLSGAKLYGATFEIFNDNGTKKFRLKNTFTANWDGDYDNDGELDYHKIIGNFTCLSTSATCTKLYYAGHYQSSKNSYTKNYVIANNAHYSQVGMSSLNAYDNSPGLVGYMYNELDYFDYKSLSESYHVITQTYFYRTSTSYYYGDTATWVNDHYELTIGGVTPTSTIAWSDIYSSATGMYTCMSDTKKSCTTVNYIVSSTSSYMYSIPLSNNEQADTKTVTWTVGTGYTESNGNYSLTGTKTVSFLLKDWFTNYNNSNYKKVYICDNMTSSTCTNNVYYIGETYNHYFYYNTSANTYVFANDIEYVNGEYKLIKTDPTNKPYQSVWDWYKKYNTINNTHYTCYGDYDATNNSCGGTIYFIYGTNNFSYYTYRLKLTNGEKIEDALQKMLNTKNLSSSNLNKYNSAMKGVIESWYENNLLNLSEYIDDDAVFCNDRSIRDLGGWSPTGSLTSDIRFKYYNYPNKNNASLSCTNITDRFSKTNPKAKLTYPVGLLSVPEWAMMYRGFAATGKAWVLGAPDFISATDIHMTGVTSTGTMDNTLIDSSYGVRPTIVLKPGVEVLEGNGTYNNPYIIDALPTLSLIP